MLGEPTGLMKDIQCGCLAIVTQYHIRAGKLTFWVSKEHKAPCGRPCSLSPGSLIGDCHIPGKCPLCPTQRNQRRGPRPRVKAETTASPILGQLTVNEVRVLNYALQAGFGDRLRAPIIGAVLMIPDATVRGTLRRLAVRGVMFQDAKTRDWLLNVPPKVIHELVAAQDQSAVSRVQEAPGPGRHERSVEPDPSGLDA